MREVFDVNWDEQSIFYSRFDDMEDSGIWYYLVIGAIYILSKFFGKKKAPEGGEPIDLPDLQPGQSQPTKKNRRTPTFEELLRELTEDVTPEEAKRPIPDAPKPIEQSPIQAQEIVDYQSTNIEAVHPDEHIDIVPHKPIERKKPVYGRSENYTLSEESNIVAEGVHELLEEQNGLQKAFVLKELLDRKY